MKRPKKRKDCSYDLVWNLNIHVKKQDEYIDYLEDKLNIVDLDDVRLSFISIEKAVNDLSLSKRVKWFVWNGELVRKGKLCPEAVIVNGKPVLINEA